MRKIFHVSILSLMVLSFAGCAAQSPNTKTGEGALIGGGLGALAGGIIGHQTDDTATGLLIGGAVGALGGAAVGSQIPREQQVYAPSGPVMPINQVTMQQIVDWSAQGLPGDEIISRIRTTHSTYVLTPDDISYLRKNGVSQRVVEAMQQTG